jgi:hypothetical protein
MGLLSFLPLSGNLSTIEISRFYAVSWLLVRKRVETAERLPESTVEELGMGFLRDTDINPQLDPRLKAVLKI